MMIMAERKRSKSPQDYLTSQRGRAKAMAKETGGNVGELLEQHFHRRLIARVFDGAEADK